MSIGVGVPLGNFDPQLSAYLRELARKAVDGSTEDFRVLKHKLANIANATSISGTASETDFSITHTLSRHLYQPGRIFKLEQHGLYTTNTPGTSTGYRFRIKLNASNFIVFTNKAGITDASNVPWSIEATIVVRSIGTSGILVGHGNLIFNTSAGVATVEAARGPATTVNTESTTEIALTTSVQMDDTDGQCDLIDSIFYASDF